MEEENNRLVAVTCSSHSQELVSGLWQLFTTQHAVDFELELGEQSIRMHQLILEVFHLSPEMLDKSNEVMELKEDAGADVGVAEDGCLYPLIQFMYTGHVDVRQGQLDSLARAANKFHFRMLADAIRRVRSGNESLKASDGIGTDPLPDKQCQQHNDLSEGDQLNDEDLLQLDSEWDILEDDAGDASSDNDSDWLTSSQGGGSRSGSSKAQKKAISSTSRRKTVVPAITSTSVTKRPLRRVRNTAARLKRRASLPTRTYQCPRCDFTSTGSWKHRHHLNTVHGVTTRGEPFQQLRCPDCPYTAIDRNQLKYHAVRHSSDKPYKCQHCSYASGLKGCIVRHTAIVHPETLPADSVEPPRLLVCSHCDRFRTYKKRTYQHHLYSVHRLRTNGEPLPGPSFTCEECGYECVNASILKNHQLVKHSGEKPYHCPHCSYASSRKGRLGQHVREVHLALRPYMCETCGYRAPSTVKLEQHRQVHTEARPYTCDVCGQTYKDQGSFKRHVRRHVSDERPHVCHLCSRAFNRRSNLKVHLKNVHKHDSLPEPDINQHPHQTLSPLQPVGT